MWKVVDLLVGELLNHAPTTEPIWVNEKIQNVDNKYRPLFNPKYPNPLLYRDFEKKRNILNS